MASVTLYDVFESTFVHGLQTLAAVLEKGEEYAKEKGLNPDSFVTASLIEDMKPLGFQVFIATNTAKKSAQRVRGDEVDNVPDDDTTLAALKARVQKTLDLVQTLTPADFKGKDNLQVEQNPPATLKEATLNVAVPNFFFHIQTAYCILRAQGVPLGKKIYLANFRGY